MTTNLMGEQSATAEDLIISDLQEQVRELKAELADSNAARDLAVAHDSQPYPTAESYEAACLALNQSKARIIESWICRSCGRHGAGDLRSREHSDVCDGSRITALESALKQALEALKQVRCHECGQRLGGADGGIEDCPVCWIPLAAITAGRQVLP